MCGGHAESRQPIAGRFDLNFKEMARRRVRERLGGVRFASFF